MGNSAVDGFEKRFLLKLTLCTVTMVYSHWPWIYLFYYAMYKTKRHFYRPQRSCGKVMFLHLSVILFTGGHVCRGACMAGGHVWQGEHVWWGACMVGGVHGRGGMHGGGGHV